jgi:hypothetical protein
MPPYDIVFVGHVCRDEIVPFEGPVTIAPGSAVTCGALVAARIGKRTAAVVKAAPGDEEVVAPLRQAGVDLHVVPAAETTYMRVVHPTADVDVRDIFQVRNAGRFAAGDIPDIETSHIHLAGITDQEFTLELLSDLRNRPCTLSADMQGFVRQVDGQTGVVHLRDVPEKARIARLLNSVKLDVVEARILTGHAELEPAALEIERWGCREVVITESRGVLARSDGRTYYENFTNTGSVGRTGRGDTTFAAYLCHRMDHGAAGSLKFAAALVSIKMESAGPFSGTLQDVLERMNAARG